MRISGASAATVRQLGRYAMVGLFSNAIGYLIYLLLTSLGLTPKVAMTLLYATSATVSYFGNRRLTFSFAGGLISSGARYLIAHAAGYLLNFAILTVFVDRLGYAHQLVQGIAILIVAVFLFVSFKFFVFKSGS